MKGLLIKDFKLLKVQKNSFLLILCIAIGMGVQPIVHHLLSSSAIYHSSPHCLRSARLATMNSITAMPFSSPYLSHEKL